MTHQPGDQQRAAPLHDARGRACVTTLREWVGGTAPKKLYDSTVDEFTADAFIQSLYNRRRVVMLETTTVGDVFGVAINPPFTPQDERLSDPSAFLFSFESHGRCATPQRFAASHELRLGLQVALYHQHTCGFLCVWANGGGEVYFGGERSSSFCSDLDQVFEPIGAKTLTGNNGFYRFHRARRLEAFSFE